MMANRFTGSICTSSLLHKHRLQFHRANSVNLAINIVVFVNQAIDADFGSDLGDFGCAFGLLGL